MDSDPPSSTPTSNSTSTPALQLKRHKGHSQEVTALVSQPPLLLSASADRTLRLWESAKTKSVFTDPHIPS